MPKFNQKLRDSIDEYIGEEPVVKQSDKERFYQWVDQYENNYRVEGRKFWIPRLASLILIVSVISFGWFMYSAEQEPRQLEIPPAGGVEKDEIEEDVEKVEIPFQQIAEKIEEIKSKYTVGMTMSEVQEIFGEGDWYEGNSEEDGEHFEALEYRFFTSEAGENILNPQGIEPYLNGDIGLSFNVIWYDGGVTYAVINFLSHQNDELSRISFNSDGTIFEDGRLIDNIHYRIDAHNYLVEAIAESLNKPAEEVTYEDVVTMTSLTIDPTNKNLSPYDFGVGLDYLENMKNLKYLHTVDQFVPKETLVILSNLETLIVEGQGNLGNLAELKSLTNLEYMDISNTEITTVSQLTELVNLKHVVLNKNQIKDWQVLEEHGIEVTEK